MPKVAEIAAVSDWRRALELRGPQLVFDVPVRIPVTGWIAEGALQRCHRAINGALTPARKTGESILGGDAEGFAVGSRSKWTREAPAASLIGAAWK
jgi:hypothetical protein